MFLFVNVNITQFHAAM